MKSDVGSITITEVMSPPARVVWIEISWESSAWLETTASPPARVVWIEMQLEASGALEAGQVATREGGVD